MHNTHNTIVIRDTEIGEKSIQTSENKAYSYILQNTVSNYLDTAKQTHVNLASVTFIYIILIRHIQKHINHSLNSPILHTDLFIKQDQT